MRFLVPQSLTNLKSGPLRRFWVAAGLLVLASSGGCWDEVAYDATGRPPKGAATPPAVTGSQQAAPQGDEKGSSDPGASGDPVDSGPDVVTPAGNDVPVTPTGEAGDGDVDPAGAVESDPPPDDVTTAPPIVAVAPPIVVEADEIPAPPAPTAAERQRAWTLASDWSLAAAGYAAGFDEARYEPFLSAASEAGNALGIAVPPFPATEDAEKRKAAVVELLKTGGGATLVKAVGERLDPAVGAAAQLAINAHLLLLTYSPDGSHVWADAVAIRDAGVDSQLPPELWRPLLEVLERRGEFVEVRGAVFDLREKVAAELASKTGV